MSTPPKRSTVARCQASIDSADRHIGYRRHHLRAGLFRNPRSGGIDRLRFARRNRDLRAFGCQRLGDGKPQPLAGGRHHRNFSFDSEIHPVSVSSLPGHAALLRVTV